MINEAEKLLTFRGRRIEDMSREELVSALNWFAAEYRRQNSPFLSECRAVGHVELMKQGRA